MGKLYGLCEFVDCLLRHLRQVETILPFAMLLVFSVHAHAGTWEANRAKEEVAARHNGRVDKYTRGTRADVTTRTHVIEVDDAKHYERAIQEARDSARGTGKKAGVSFTGGSQFDQDRARRKAKKAGVDVFE